MPLFSVIIPTYNRAEMLRQALDSVVAQEFRDYEIIVVDDGSTDETPTMMARDVRGIQFLRQPNSGPGAARNAGISAASGEYIAFLDSDDVWFPWTLNTVYWAIAHHGFPAMLLGECVRFHREVELEGVRRQNEIRTRWFNDFLTAAQVPIFWGTGYAVVKRTALPSSDCFAPGIRAFEDQDCGLRLGIQPGCVKIDAPKTVAYRETPRSLTTDLQGAREGTGYLVEQERSLQYPGGRRRRRERQRYIAYSLRSVAFALLQNARIREALALYCQSLAWHIALRRFRFAFGFPLLCAIHTIPFPRTLVPSKDARTGGSRNAQKQGAPSVK